MADLHVAWIAVAALLALQEAVAGGLRMFVLTRVVASEIRLRTVLVSEFVLMFVGGVTPGQIGAPIAQVAVLVHGGAPFAAIATAELLTACCTILFFLTSSVAVLALRHAGLFAVPSAGVDWLMGFSAAVFGTVLVVLILCAWWPPLLKGAIRVGSAVGGRLTDAAIHALAPIGRLGRLASEALRLRRTSRVLRMTAFVDDFHAGFAIYRRRGKAALVAALLLTFALFWSRFAIAYCLVRALGIPTTPIHFVAAGPPLVQIILVQTVLSFALYLSPTPGASGIAEAGSTALMAPWVHGAYELPFLVLWRLFALFLCMFVGGVYVFRYLGTDVLASLVREAEARRGVNNP
jgi:glycosyltransferase 2 family protein